ncbi:MAG: restriction endonuclease subunit S [Bacteroidales bacterium]|nr:restriction endonuclease subunit S [Bacteroidales bacterium]
MEENKIVKLSDVCDLIPGFAFKSSEFGEHQTKAVKIGDIQPPYVNYASMAGVDVTKYTLSKLAKYEIHKGDFVLAMTGATIGKIGRYISNTGAYINQRVLKFKPHEDVNSDFIYYIVSSTSFQKYILNNVDSETAQPNISAGSVGKYEFELPSLEEQNRIADILVSLDNKIQLNRQINDNLEQQASSLLSDWISTYPCRTYKLSDICKYANAKCETGNLTPQNYISTENMLPNRKGIVEASNIPTGKVTCYKVDDVLIANIRPYFQKIWKADINGGCSADVLCIRANIESHSPILYWLLHQDAFFEYVMTGAKGCKMPRGDKQHIMNWSIDLPEVQYWADLATQLGSIDQQIAYNRIESINLSNLRDTLLPKLMSGELKINEIDC